MFSVFMYNTRNSKDVTYLQDVDSFLIILIINEHYKTNMNGPDIVVTEMGHCVALLARGLGSIPKTGK